jgi:hypothetical protein
VAIVHGYADMCRRLVEHWRRRVPERLAARRVRARERLAALAARARLSEDRLTELAALWRPPVVADLGRLVRAVMLDRLLLVLLGPLIATLPLLVFPSGWQLAGAGVLGVPLAAWFGTALRPREPSDPRSAMRSSAGHIRRIAGVPIVVMGHSVCGARGLGLVLQHRDLGRGRRSAQGVHPPHDRAHRRRGPRTSVPVARRREPHLRR